MPLIRTEQPKDNSSIIAFISNTLSNESDQQYIKKLKSTSYYDKELSLIIEEDNNILGHILFSRIVIKSESKTYPSLVLASVILSKELNSKPLFDLYIKEAFKHVKYLGYKLVFASASASILTSIGFQDAEPYDLSIIDSSIVQNLFIHKLGYEDVTLSGDVYYPVEFHSTYLSPLNTSTNL